MGRVDRPRFQTKALVITSISDDNFLEISHPIAWFVRHVCSDKAVFFFAEEDCFLMLFQAYTKMTFGLSDILVITVIARNRTNSLGSLYFRDRILTFGKNMP